MIIVDVNLLLYAVITGFAEHQRARAWFEATLNSPTQVVLTAPAVFGFLRIATSPRVMVSPLPVADAVGYIQSWLERPNVEFRSPGPRHLAIAFDLLARIGTAGNLTTDVQLAAYAIEFDAEICSNDADFGRFPDVRWANPLSPG
ncbi:type II toxin-antitoxin system VapC family toxin [Natronosporangium hydrolyticum]|uniref:Ribonuclease VapC n=1 Tax=Natronosporangium hydrolyticum TaxID=2811111 RepID=A0A895YM38_9ACTN|nr:type II toxin-antitoxin system VapC family toxin [Natronosporangium hydrolyticum]QSB14948.1 type II toxin-antitoxin system VapC family toxin [Natronosporangium hydrolyticum]